MHYTSRRLQSKFELWWKSHFTLRNLLTICIPLLLVGIILPILVGLVLQSVYTPKIITAEDKLEKHQLGVLLTPEITNAENNLENNLQTAMKLYKDGYLNKLIIMGKDADVVSSVVAELTKANIPTTSVVSDTKADSIYAACFRAGRVYGLGQLSVIADQLVLPRVLYVCNSLNINAYGFYSQHDQVISLKDQILETLKLSQAVWDVNVSQPVVQGKNERIKL